MGSSIYALPFSRRRCRRLLLLLSDRAARFRSLGRAENSIAVAVDRMTGGLAGGELIPELCAWFRNCSMLPVVAAAAAETSRAMSVAAASSSRAAHSSEQHFIQSLELTKNDDDDECDGKLALEKPVQRASLSVCVTAARPLKGLSPDVDVDVD